MVNFRPKCCTKNYTDHIAIAIKNPSGLSYHLVAKSICFIGKPILHHNFRLWKYKLFTEIKFISVLPTFQLIKQSL